MDVEAVAAGPNPTDRLPPPAEVAGFVRVAELVAPPLSDEAKLSL